jgi:hypothetical protein
MTHIFNVAFDFIPSAWYYKAIFVVALYALTVIAAAIVANVIGGYEWADKVIDTYGKPITKACELVYALVLLVFWPIRYRRHRITMERVFNTRRPSQNQIDTKLNELGDAWWKATSADIKSTSKSLHRDLSKVHRAAKFFGFGVGQYLSDYMYGNFDGRQLRRVA